MVIFISSRHLSPHVHTTRKATELPSLTDISILTHTSYTKQMPTSGSDSATNRWGKKKSPQGSILGVMASVPCVLPDWEGQNPQFLEDWNIHGLWALAKALWHVLPAAELRIPLPNLLAPGLAWLGEQRPLQGENGTEPGPAAATPHALRRRQMGFLPFVYL